MNCALVTARFLVVFFRKQIKKSNCFQLNADRNVLAQIETARLGFPSALIASRYALFCTVASWTPPCLTVSLERAGLSPTACELQGQRAAYTPRPESVCLSVCLCVCRRPDPCVLIVLCESWMVSVFCPLTKKKKKKMLAEWVCFPGEPQVKRSQASLYF